MIADQKRAFHRGGRNLESLNDKGSAKKREDYGNQQGFEILGKGGLFAVVLAPMRLRVRGLGTCRLLNGGFLGHDFSLSRPSAPANGPARDAPLVAPLLAW